MPANADVPRYEPFLARHFPGWGKARESARLQRETLATYRGAMRGRGTRYPTNGRTTIGGSRVDRLSQGEMRDRADDAYKNNPFARSIQNVETDNIIGQGLNFQAQTDSEDFNNECEDRWLADSAEFDITGLRTWGQFQQQAWTRPRVDGDGGIVLVDSFGQSRLQYISGNQIVTPPGQYNNRNMFDGVECDATMRPIRFHVENWDQNGKLTYEAVEAEDFIYLPFLDDPQAVRGTTSYAQCFNYLEHLDGYVDAVVQAARAIAAISIIFRKKNASAAYNQLPFILNADGSEQRVITLENGSIKYVGSEDEVAQPTPQQPMQQTPEFIRAMLRVICMAFDMPLEIGGRDLSQVNFSGGRIGLIAWYRSCRSKQDVAKRWMSRVYRWWLSRQLKMGRFKTLPPHYGEPGAYQLWTKHTFSGHEWAYVDPEKEAAADLLEITMGIKSPQMAAGERGRDAKAILDQNQLWRKLCKEANVPIVLSSSTRDEITKTTAIDADGNPLSGGSDAPLNGIQITSAIDVLTKVTEKLIEADTAVELISRLNIAPDRAKAMVAAASKRDGISAGDRDFQREMLKLLASNPAARDAVYEGTDMEDLMKQSGMPVEEGYQFPHIPVVAPAGEIVSGDVIKDPQGDIVGGNVEPYGSAEPSAPKSEEKKTDAAE